MQIWHERVARVDQRCQNVPQGGETSPEWATKTLEIRQYEKTETRDLTRANGYIQRLKDVWSK